MFHPRGRSLLAVAALCLVAASFGREGRAGIILTQPRVKETGDPIVTYDIQISLTPRSVLDSVTTLTTDKTGVYDSVDDFLTIYDIKGLAALKQPPTFSFTPAAGLVAGALNDLKLLSVQDYGITPGALQGDPNLTDTVLPNVTIALVTPNPNVFESVANPSFDQNLLLGTLHLEFDTADEGPPTQHLNYSWQTDEVKSAGIDAGSGSVDAAFTPEPSTLAPAASGLGLVAAWWLARWRARTRRPG
jgi:hypothetical protein